MKNRLWWVAGLITLYLVVIGCTLKTVETMETGAEGTHKNRVLIATQQSKFKYAVVSEIQETLNNHSIYVKVVDVRRLLDESVSDYHAVVILSRCMAGRPDPRVETFIDTTAEKNRVIVLTTGRMDSWKPDSKRVDAMTSASAMSESTAIALSITGKVLALIEFRHND